MASIFDTEKKQPITTKDLLCAGFRVNRKSVANDTHEAFFEFDALAPHTNTKTWVIRFYPRGTVFNGQKLRSNRLIYKDFQSDKTRKEIDNCCMKRMRKNNTSGPLSRSGKMRSKKMPTQGYYTKKYMRNIGKLELDLVLSTVSNQFKNLK